MNNQSCWFGLALLTFVGVFGCGSGGGGSSGTENKGASIIPSMSSAQAASEFVAVLNGLSGTQSSPVAHTGGLSGVTYSYTVLGFSFCNPSDPFMAPLASPRPGQTVYGCANAVQGTASLDTSALTLTVFLAIPFVYVDFSVNTTQFGLTSHYAGALTATNPVVSLTYNIVEQPDGNYKLGSVSNSNFTATWNIKYTPSSILAMVVDMIGPFVQATPRWREVGNVVLHK
jgi:hypothetical protein